MHAEHAEVERMRLVHGALAEQRVDHRAWSFSARPVTALPALAITAPWPTSRIGRRAPLRWAAALDVRGVAAARNRVSEKLDLFREVGAAGALLTALGIGADGRWWR